MTTPTTHTNPCGTARASLLYHAPILSELGACVLPHGHDGDHRDPWDRTWNVTPPHPTTNTGRGTDR
ncbi:hypothetical protein ACH4TV_02045 [Streptomyces sp. NPDC020898]|uniref:hypothetical protein n=1 Tax=Streptomyces sp. NPDC020898 TaxID=3365101 RepID=UPI0037AA989E